MQFDAHILSRVKALRWVRGRPPQGRYPGFLRPARSRGVLPDGTLALGLVLVLLTVITLPYVYLYWAGVRQDRVFIGVIYNLPDNLSYLAKMLQGYRGAWRFRLPYTADAEPAAVLFVFHLALGHLARALHLPILVVYHLARLSGAALLVLVLGWWYRAWSGGAPWWRKAWAWGVFAVGMDAWGFLFYKGLAVSEVYPFLSVLFNAHFPWALVLLVVAMHPHWPRWLQARRGYGLGLLLLGLGMALVAPFGVLVAGLAWALWGAWGKVRHGRSPWPAWAVAALLGLGAAPYLGYVLWAVHQDPWLAGWNAQNRTPIRGFWPTFFLFTPWWVGVAVAWRRRREDWAYFWVLASWAWALAPLALQRRMWLGVAIPMVGLTAAARHPWPRWVRWLLPVLVAPTWGLYLVGAMYNAHLPHSPLFLAWEEADLFAWMETHLPADARVLTGPVTGMYVPAFAGQRVFYGHGFETVDSEKEQAWVTWMLCEAPPAVARRELERRRVDLVLWTARERRLCGHGPPAWARAYPVLWERGSVRLYGVRLP